eukprot:s2029_g7.t3
MNVLGLLMEHPVSSGCAAATLAVALAAATRKPEPPAEVQAAAKAKEPWESHVVSALSNLQEISPGRLWQVSAKGASGGPPMRNMTLYRPEGSGELVVFSAVALEASLMEQVEALGRPAVLVVPNAYHREDAAVWKARYPDCKVCAPQGSTWVRERIAKVVTVDFDSRELSQRYSGSIAVEAIDGWNLNSEEVFEYFYTLELADGTRAYYVCDMLLRTNPGFMSWVFGSGPLPGGFPRVGRLGKLFLHDRKRVAKFYVQLAQQNISIICYAHGDAFRGDCGAEHWSHAGQLARSSRSKHPSAFQMLRFECKAAFEAIAADLDAMCDLKEDHEAACQGEAGPASVKRRKRE